MKDSNIVHFEGSTIDLTKGRRSRFIIKPDEEVQITIKPLTESNKKKAVKTAKP